MKLRRPKPEEYTKLLEMHVHLKGEFPFPDFTQISSAYVVENNDGEVVGFGAVQPIYEAVVILDPSKSLPDRVEAIGMLQDIAELELRHEGVHQIHAFVQNNTFGNFLKRRLGFKKTKGSAMVKVI